ncbi:putative glucose-methanol-choline oxidoreductase, FAD/NAD(P)-binding domain superfamily [Septoria linicola]|nr:putative glucose-methanol-choline oxidoreductase, FAD/NAD(P)-binding domain superfamily [Septoria linicola]
MSAFTHIVVGAGSAGCVVAARIAENPGFNVLLLEAGPDCLEPEVASGSQDARRVPMKGQSEIFNDRIDWNLRVELPGNASMHVAQAKVVGGGSSINGGTALRNAVRDCEEWTELGNDAGDWQSVESVYAALEKDERSRKSGLHPLTRMQPKEAGKIQQAFVAGAMECGFPWAENLNGTGVEGVGSSPVCREGNVRVSAANTFIDPIRKNQNFQLWPNTCVDRIAFTDGNAIGVVLNDQRHISASTEIILAASAVFTPAILQRSGIGPSALLSPYSIPVQQDLPVGDNLVDHPCVPVVARPKPGSYQESDFSLQMQARWSSSATKAVDVQMVCFSYLYAAPPDPSSQSVRSLGGSAAGHVAGIGCNVNKPTSRGTVQIQSRDPNTQPLVSPNYLTTDFDRACARQCVRSAYQIITSDAMQQQLSDPLSLTEQIIASDSLLDDWIRSQYSSTYHFASSCRMASRQKGGVVDQSGRVYGVRRLRIADASVIPTVPAANTMWTTMMFADRIGRSIRDQKPVTTGRCVNKSLL